VDQIPIVGQKWLGSYQIEKPVAWFQGEQAWEAYNASACEKVIIIQVHTMDHMRDEAWDKLHQHSCEHLWEPRDSRLILENRFEVYHKPEGPTLRAWLAQGKRPSPTILNSWIGQLTAALTALHDLSVAHCYLSPECIYVVTPEEKGPPSLVVGGIERSVRFDRTEMIQITGDPFYAPPESAGLFRQTPGDAMKAWDWWSLGRVIQEIVLGRHILEHLFDHEMPHDGVEEREQAEKLLLEKGHGNTKAGGVEAMPPMDKRIDLLLLGLLTGSRDARWGAEDMQRWLKGETPPERYKLPRGERLFKWRGRSYTVPEAAEVLRTEENWELAPDQLQRRDDPSTLISFIKDTPQLRLFAQKIDECNALSNAPDLRPFSAALIREVIVASALHRLAGGPFIWRGKRLDNAAMHAMLAVHEKKGAALERDAATPTPPPPAKGAKPGAAAAPAEPKAKPAPPEVEAALAMVQILCSPPIIGPLEKLDYEAWRVLGEAAKLSAKAIVLATRLKLMARGDNNEIARIWSLSFQSPTAWQQRIDELKQAYACSELAEIQELYTKEHPLPEELLVLALLAPQALKLKFISHEEWSKREYGKLHARGSQLAHALFWLRLRRAMRVGLLWYGHVGVVFGVWLLLTALIALAWPGPFYAPLLGVPLVLALTMRFSLRGLVLPLLRQCFAGPAKWGLWDGSHRCDVEVRRFPEGRLKRGAIKDQLEEINHNLRELKHLNPPPALVRIPPTMVSLRLIALLSWPLLILPGTLAVMKIKATPNPFIDFQVAWFPKEEDLEYYPEAPPYRIDFPFEVPKKAKFLSFEETSEVSEIQAKLGVRRGASQVSGYIIETIGANILVRVPSDKKLSFVIYDPKRSDLAAKKVYHVKTPPARKSCVMIDGKMAFVLDY